MAHKSARSADLTSPVIRGAFFYIHEKRTKDGNKAPIPPEKQKYEFLGLIPKTNPDAMQCPNYRLFSDLAMQAVAGCADFSGQFPAGGQWPIKDGDQKVAKYPWQAGHWVIKFDSTYPPRVCVLQNGQPSEIPARRVGTQDLYKSGDYVVVSTHAFTYDNNSKGVKFSIDGVMFVGAGEVIGQGQKSATQMFGNIGPVALPAGASPVGTAQGPALVAPQIPGNGSVHPHPHIAPPAAPQYAPAPPTPA